MYFLGDQNEQFQTNKLIKITTNTEELNPSPLNISDILREKFKWLAPHYLLVALVNRNWLEMAQEANANFLKQQGNCNNYYT